MRVTTDPRPQAPPSAPPTDFLSPSHSLLLCPWFIQAPPTPQNPLCSPSLPLKPRPFLQGPQFPAHQAPPPARLLHPQVKSMALHLLLGQRLDTPRKLRFPGRFLDDIAALVGSVGLEVITRVHKVRDSGPQ
jgi:hypothetical protein